MIGHASHQEALSLAGIAKTAWPFLVGLALAWVAMAYLHTRVTKLAAGVLVWLLTWGVGIVLRLVTKVGAPVPFLIVSALALAVLLIGWRLAYGLIRRRRSAA